MDEFSLYCTIGAIVLIQVAFFWLFRYDYYTRKLSLDYMQSNRLVVILVGAQETRAPDCEGASAPSERSIGGQDSLIEILREQLQKSTANFKVITILLTPAGGEQVGQLSERRGQQEFDAEAKARAQIIGPDGILHLNSSGAMNYHHLERVVDFVEAQLAASLGQDDEADDAVEGAKLHAYIDLQQLDAGARDARGRPVDVLEHLRTHSIASFGLLFALQRLLARDRARLVFVRDRRRENPSSAQDLDWQLFGRVHESAIELVDKCEQFQSSPAPIKVDVKPRDERRGANVRARKSRSTFDLRGCLSNHQLAGESLGQSVGKEAQVYAAERRAGQMSADARLAETEGIAKRIADLLELEHPRSLRMIV